MPPKQSNNREEREDLSNITVRPSKKQRMKLANLVADQTRAAGKSVSFNAAILSLIDQLPDAEDPPAPARRRPAKRSEVESVQEPK